VRQSKTKAAQLQAEMAEANRRDKRERAFYFGKNERDRGWGRLRDLRGADVVMVWGVRDDLAAANKFKLVINGQELILDAEEVRRCLRWA